MFREHCSEYATERVLNYHSIMFRAQSAREKLARSPYGIVQGLLADAQAILELETPLVIRPKAQNEAEFVASLEKAYCGPQDPSTKWRAFVLTIIDLAIKSKNLPKGAVILIEKIEGIPLNSVYVAGIIKGLLEKNDPKTFVTKDFEKHWEIAKACGAIKDNKATAYARLWYYNKLAKLTGTIESWTSQDVGEMMDRGYIADYLKNTSI